MKKKLCEVPLTHSTEHLQAWLGAVTAATRAHGGVAARLPTRAILPPTDAWGFPRYPGRTVILPRDADLDAALASFVVANEQQLHEQECCLGTWLNPHTDHYYFDITTSCVDLAEACQRARSLSVAHGRKIVAVYNSARQETVYLWDDVLA